MNTGFTRERVRNVADHRFTNPRAGKGDGRNACHDSLIHRVAGRSVVLRRLSARRRLARTGPEAVERKAWRIIGGDAG
jgi:hypothetical protein